MRYFLQLLLLIFTTVLFHISTTNPNISSSADYVAYEGLGSTLRVSFAPKLAKVLMWISTLYQMLYILLKMTSSTSISTFFPNVVTDTDPLPLTSIVVFGYIFMILGGLGRIWCYRTLGKFFTFEITIRNSHRLIKTGPYAYVRHPSYTFASILTIGQFLIHRRLSNFFPSNTWSQFYFHPVALSISFMILMFFLRRRVIREEQELAKKFGKEWTEHVSRTKGFIPGLI
ncbi:unnamed protein product [Rotaria magnacalcarata]|uniref:Protein-S-isoprenylcysteine O-methyltransferase n=1 Tax=Rotaria magnacalcarata TaxID=392030 RepID=A0A819L4V5_9BILA|nr:unnamed protein product [Rotaria magnacalcarata]CAF3956754.1 unnamed protein product [Rotaria magnacalcarata]